MGDENGKFNPLPWAGALGILVVVLVGMDFYLGNTKRIDKHQKARAPVPAIGGALKQNKSLCEDYAASVKGKRRPPRDLEHGKELYANARAAQEKCIEFLTLSLKGFTPKHAKDGKKLSDQALASSREFLDWATKAGLNKRHTGDIQGSPSLLDLIGWAKKADDQEVEHLKQSLEKSSLLPWDKISPARSEDTGDR